jgi:hypothetical protein
MDSVCNHQVFKENVMQNNIYKETEPMKVIAFNGSARKNGNTEILIKHVFTEGMETMAVLR